MRLGDVTDETFSIAADHLGEDEILASVQLWIREERARFLVERGRQPRLVARRGHRGHPPPAPYPGRGDRVPAGGGEGAARLPHLPLLHRPARASSTSPSATSRSTTTSTSSSTWSSRPRAAASWAARAPGSSWPCRSSRRSRTEPPELGTIKTPRTWYITTDGVLDFIQYNNLEDVYNQKYADIDQVRHEYPHIVQIFKNSAFTPEIIKGLSVVLDDLEGRPLIVRSRACSRTASAPPSRASTRASSSPTPAPSRSGWPR